MGGLAYSNAPWPQVAIDDSVPVAVGVWVGPSGTTATLRWTTGYPPDRPSVRVWAVAVGWTPPAGPATAVVNASAVLDPLGNPKYHYTAELTGLAAGAAHYAVPSDFHPDQDFVARRAIGHRLCFDARPGSVWGTEWLVPGVDQSGPRFWDQYLSPRQVHLSWGHGPHTAVLMWATTLPPDHAGVTLRRVAGGGPSRSGEATNWTVPARVANFTVDGGTRWYARAVLAAPGGGPLPADAVLAYEAHGVFRGNETYRSAPLVFRTPPPPAAWEPALAFLGDMGTYDGLSAPELTRAVVAEGIDAVVHAGDLAYDLGTEGGSVGDRFLNGVEPVAAQVPYMASHGNHDGLPDFAARFAFPAENRTDNLFYSVDVGPVHLVAYDSEMVWGGYTPALRAQYAWLAADLARADANRAAVPFVVVHAHRPMYCSYSRYADCDSYGGGSSARRGVLVNGTWRADLEALFRAHGVDLAVFAHVHSYERFEPVFQWARDAGAMVQIISGAAGTAEGDDPFNGPPLNITAFRSQARGFGVLRASRTALRWEQRQCGWENCTSEVVDTVEIRPRRGRAVGGRP